MVGRKNVYDSKIKPYFEEIKQWVAKGATEKSIAKRLDVGYSTFNKYKVEKEEFAEILKTSRESCVDEIENAMFESAVGGKQTLWKAMKVKHIDYDDQGRRVKEYETVEKYQEEVYFPPNTTAGIYLLKHWGKSRGYTNDPASLELKKQEVEHKIKMDENNSW